MVEFGTKKALDVKLSVPIFCILALPGRSSLSLLTLAKAALPESIERSIIVATICPFSLSILTLKRSGACKTSVR